VLVGLTWEFQPLWEECQRHPAHQCAPFKITLSESERLVGDMASLISHPGLIGRRLNGDKENSQASSLAKYNGILANAWTLSPRLYQQTLTCILKHGQSFRPRETQAVRGAAKPQGCHKGLLFCQKVWELSLGAKTFHVLEVLWRLTKRQPRLSFLVRRVQN
jgi:hypothetical protein